MDSDEKRRLFGQRVARLRVEQGLSQKRLGDMCGKSQYHIYLIEAGKVYPRLDTVIALAAALGTTESELLSF